MRTSDISDLVLDCNHSFSSRNTVNNPDVPVVM